VNPLYKRSVTIVMAVVVFVGFALLVQTARHGGGTVGFAVGALFVALGSGRLYLLRRQSGS
jgi:hypothetical protein